MNNKMQKENSMRKKTILGLSIFAVFFIIYGQTTASTAPNRVNAPSGLTKTTQLKSLHESVTSAPGKTVRLEDMQADLTITAWDRNEIVIEGSVEVGNSNTQMLTEFLAGTKLSIEPSGDGFSVKLHTPFEWRQKKGTWSLSGALSNFLRSGKFNFSYSARLDVHVPSDQSLVVNNSFGNMKLSGVNGKHDIRNESGEVRVEGCGGSLSLRNSFATSNIVQFKGPATVDNESGDVLLEEISGVVEVRNSFKTVRFNKIGASITIKSESADVIGSDVAGDCRITSSFKAIDVRGIQGRLEVRGESSEVTVDNVKKDVVIESSFKPVKVTNVQGGLKVISESAAVTAGDIAGEANIKSSFNEISAARVHGTVTIDGESCAVTLREIDGNAAITSSFKEITASNIGGTLDIKSQSAKVIATDIKKGASIASSFNSIEVRRVGGNVKVDGESASVLVEEAAGNVEVQNSFKYVILRQTSGSIRVVGDSSGVEVSQIRMLPKGSTIDIRTSFKPIMVAIPKDAEVAVSAKTEFGKIHSDYPVYLGGEDNRPAVGVGKGTIPVRLETSADITIKKEL
jgi:hypothetical protein